jgi:ribonuclease P protein component
VKQAFISQTLPLAFSSAFKKSSRLLSSSDFQTVFNDAPLRASHQHFLLLARQNKLASCRLGLVIAKKHVRLAVERNRIKRLIRETFRVKQQQLTGLDVIVLARKGMNELPNAQLIDQLNLQWFRLMRKNQILETNRGIENTNKGDHACTE